MKKLLPVLFLFMFLIACAQSSGKSDPICNCYKLFVDEVKKQSLDYEHSGVSNRLVEIYTNLAKENSEFLKCTDNSIFDGDLFSKSKLKIYKGLNPNCVDENEFEKIIDKGPYIYKNY